MVRKSAVTGTRAGVVAVETTAETVRMSTQAKNLFKMHVESMMLHVGWQVIF